MTIIEVTHDQFDNWYEAATFIEKCVLSDLVNATWIDPEGTGTGWQLFSRFMPFVGAITDLKPKVDKWRVAQEKVNWADNPKHLMNLNILMEDAQQLINCHFPKSTMCWLDTTSRALGYLERLMAIMDVGIDVDEYVLYSRTDRDTLILIDDNKSVTKDVTGAITRALGENPETKASFTDVCLMKYEAWLSDVYPHATMNSKVPNHLPFGSSLSRNFNHRFRKQPYGQGFHNTLKKKFFAYLREEQKLLFGWKPITPFSLNSGGMVDNPGDRLYQDFLDSTQVFQENAKNNMVNFKDLMGDRVLELDSLALFLKKNSYGSQSQWLNPESIEQIKVQNRELIPSTLITIVSSIDMIE